ncbi:hypothetical protein [Klebsiella pneumoniae]|uniref:hypothetical protein n=1 Tax=Klebsiella pneumoniae TaxID=573 RepID=UPI0018A7A9C3|nr:hypothetical protein [Klebsiella pneumoniae]MBF8421003.1 hypothetical protein [Klebsiella pneumoniae]
MTNNQLTTERLEIMLAGTIGTIAARGEQASIEVTASIFISLLTEVLECRKADAELKALLQPEVIICERCGRTTTHPEGWHYCHGGKK